MKNSATLEEGFDPFSDGGAPRFGGDDWRGGGDRFGGGDRSGGDRGGFGGGWHEDGYHTHDDVAGFHSSTVVNHYYGAGCQACRTGAAVATGAAIARNNDDDDDDGYIAALPTGCTVEIDGGTSYHVCDGTYYAASYGTNGLHYQVVSPP